MVCLKSVCVALDYPIYAFFCVCVCIQTLQTKGFSSVVYFEIGVFYFSLIHGPW